MGGGEDWGFWVFFEGVDWEDPIGDFWMGKVFELAKVFVK
jgi:hypothetical protein